MKTRFKKKWAIALCIVLIVGIGRVWLGLAARQQLKKVATSELYDLRNAGRHLMTRYHSDTAREPVIVLRRPYSSAVPQAIRDLNPWMVRYSRQMTELKMSPFNKISVMVFDEETRQFGSSRLIDGVWVIRGAIEVEQGTMRPAAENSLQEP